MDSVENDCFNTQRILCNIQHGFKIHGTSWGVKPYVNKIESDSLYVYVCLTLKYLLWHAAFMGSSLELSYEKLKFWESYHFGMTSPWRHLYINSIKYIKGRSNMFQRQTSPRLWVVPVASSACRSCNAEYLETRCGCTAADLTNTTDPMGKKGSTEAMLKSMQESSAGTRMEVLTYVSCM